MIFNVTSPSHRAHLSFLPLQTRPYFVFDALFLAVRATLWHLNHANESPSRIQDRERFGQKGGSETIIGYGRVDTTAASGYEYLYLQSGYPCHQLPDCWDKDKVSNGRDDGSVSNIACYPYFM